MPVSNIELHKPANQTTEHIDMIDSKDLEAPTPVNSDIQACIRRKVSRCISVTSWTLLI
jgi:hypothetical protein